MSGKEFKLEDAPDKEAFLRRLSERLNEDLKGSPKGTPQDPAELTRKMLEQLGGDDE